MKRRWFQLLLITLTGVTVVAVVVSFFRTISVGFVGPIGVGCLDVNLYIDHGWFRLRTIPVYDVYGFGLKCLGWGIDLDPNGSAIWHGRWLHYAKTSHYFLGFGYLETSPPGLRGAGNTRFYVCSWFWVVLCLTLMVIARSMHDRRRKQKASMSVPPGSGED